MKKLVLAAWIAVLVALLTGAKASSPVALVVCAPGYPGNTEQAQPTMDAFAGNVESRAGWKKGRLTATYYETADAGVEAMKAADAAVALVPLSLFAQYADALGLEPRLLAVPAEVTTGEQDSRQEIGGNTPNCCCGHRALLLSCTFCDFRPKGPSRVLWNQILQQGA